MLRRIVCVLGALVAAGLSAFLMVLVVKYGQVWAYFLIILVAPWSVFLLLLGFMDDDGDAGNDIPGGDGGVGLGL
ncbi:hypothetical protein AB0K51_07150 [Kitasatospora sp. NPDC049285]|uniref:hypothetical protein n=1 Tax=Kitasatospora sp. NPDC049285 TaxID=3157096 RepID=UPI003423DEE6